MSMKNMRGKTLAMVLSVTMCVGLLFGSGLLTVSAEDNSGGVETGYEVSVSDTAQTESASQDDAEVSADTQVNSTGEELESATTDGQSDTSEAALVFMSAESEADASADDLVSVQTSAYGFDGSGTADDPYQINSMDDLEGLQTDVTSSVKEYHADEYFILNTDLTLDSEWTGIGTSSTYCFKGNFDGNGHTITYDSYSSTATYVGLFLYAGASSAYASVSNLTVTGSITASKATRCAGIVATAYCYFENCVSDVDITVTTSSTSAAYTGGIVGYGQGTSATMTGCLNTGDITSTNRYAGGLAGQFSGSATNCMNTGTVTSNYSGTSSSYYAYAAGITATGGSSTKIYSCVNTGTISISTENSYSRISSIDCYSSSNSTACYSTFDLSSTSFVSYESDVTYVTSFALEQIWLLNTQGGDEENSLFWGLDTETAMAVFASDTYPAAVRVLYQLSDGTEEAVYTTYGSTAAAPASAPNADFGSFVPNSTIVYADTTAIEYKSITLTFYWDVGSTEVYTTMETATGTAFTPPTDPTRENYSFAYWVDADGNIVSEGDTLSTDSLYAVWTPAYDSETNTYTIASLDALEWFFEQVNSGSTAINGTLIADIDASSIDWTPLGTSSNEYTGTFDGGGYSVRISMADSTSSTSYAGFAAYLGSGGVIQNLTVKGDIVGTTGAGGISCYNEGTIKNCVNKASVSGGYYAGGIAAYNGGTIISCGNEADVTAEKTGSASAQAGGIAGTLEATADGSRYIYNCYNWGDISATNASTSSSYRASAGGIAGEAASTTSSSYSGNNNYVQNCYSTGTLTATGSYPYTAGVVACVVSASSTKATTYMEDCYYLDGTASAYYNSSSSSYDKGSTTDCGTFTASDYGTLLTNLNTTANEQSWDTWMADTTYDSKPAFRISVITYYTITYTGAYTGTESVAEGSAITLTWTEDVHYYYTFTLDSADGEDYDASARVYEDLTLYVTKNIYTYTVTYDIGTGDTGGSVPETKTYNSGDTVTVDFTTTPTKDGYTFNGWVDDDGNVYTSDGETQSFTILKDTTLTARYKAYDFTGSGTETDPYQIDCAAALVAMAGLVTKGDTDYSTGVYYQQTADIDLTGVDWSPAGAMGTALESGSSYLTNSEYDGNGKSITGLSYDGSDSIAAVFAGLNASTVKDLTVSGTITSSGKYAAGLVGYLYEGSTIENCTVNVNVTTTASTAYAGGMVAYATEASVISSCTYNGTVTGTYYTGGVVGYVSGGTTINGVTAYADVTAAGSSALYAGGIAGSFAGTSSAPATIVNCGHQGTVAATGATTSVTAARAGGLVGYIGTSSYYGEIINSYHGTGAVSSTGYYAGGILGQAYSSHITISNCYSASTSVTTGYTETYLPGGVIGSINSTYTPAIASSYYNSTGASQEVGYYTSTSNSTDTSGISGITSASALQILLNQWITEQEDADSYETWMIDESQNDGYPVFGEPAADTYMVLYDANGGSGTVSDDTEYEEGDTATVLGGDGLSGFYCEFLGWSTDPEATTAEYQAGDTLTIGTVNVTLYAVWKAYTYWGGSGTQEDPYTIESDAGLVELADRVAAGSSYADTYFELTKDIDLSESTEFAAIGSSSTAFNGIFDGSGCTVTYALTGSYSGLFGYTGSSAVIQDVNTAGTIADAEEDAADYSGGIAGYNQGTITNCAGSVVISSESGARAGGIAGYSTGTIDSCVFTGSVSASEYAGGIAGTLSGTVTNCAVKSGVSVTASGSTYKATAGGIAGSASGTIYNNYSQADISGYYVGGTAGTSSATVKNNYSSGTLTGTTYTGGIIGSVSGGSIQNNYYLSGTADAAAGYDYNSKAFRNGVFAADGTLSETVNVFTIAEDSTDYTAVTTLIDGLNAWVDYAGDAYSNWQETSAYPVFASDTDVSYTVSYTGDTDGFESTVVEYGGTITLPDNPTGYTYTFKIGDEVVSGTVTITANTTIEVTKTINTYTVTYTGAVEKEETAEYNTQITLPTALDGYTYTITVNGEEVTADTITITGDTTIQIVSTANTYTATFVDANGDTVGTVEFTIEDTELDEPDVVCADGYAGLWNTYEITASDITVTASYQLIGDVNNDGIINTKDALLIRRIIAGTYEADALSQLAADTDGDGTVTEEDAQRVLSYKAGNITSFASDDAAEEETDA